MTQPNINKYSKLSEVEHVLLRPGRYLGSINKEEHERWIIEEGVIDEVKLSYTPAFHKLFDEIISNSADHARTEEGKNLNRIDVTVEGDTISVFDNGGIPVVIHPEYNQYIPDMIFGELRSGSNFNDDEDSLSAGQNGEGSSLVSIFSKSFIVETALGGKKFHIEYKNNMSEKTEPKISTSKTNFTRITYTPDLARLNMESITDDDLLLLERRVNEIAFTNPNLKVTFNGKKCELTNFETFVKCYNPEAVYFETDRWRIGIAPSKTGFKHISYVNSTPSYDGGTHLDYVTSKIVDSIRTKIEKLTKQTVKPGDIKGGLTVLIDCNINNPRYNSQTKEKLITQPSQYGSTLELDDKFVKKLQTCAAVRDIVEWANRKKDLDELKKVEQQDQQARRAGFYDIPKYRPATSKDRSNCVLFVCEGDSASSPLLDASNPKIHGVFPLKGKPENCFAKKLTDVLSQEIMNVSRILNLSITKPDYTKMRYDKIIVATDADVDGRHITALLSLLFSRFWPELLKQGRVQMFQTPSVIVNYKGSVYNFIEESEYDEWIVGKTGYTTKYCKGLGGHDSKTFATFLQDPKSFVTLEYVPARDDEALSMAFDPKRADDRKDWVAVI